MASRAGRRVAGVSSFGFSGTNAHVVVEAAPPAPAPAAVVAGRALQVLPLSARTGSALRVLAGRFADHLGAAPDLPLADVAFSAATGRAQLGERLAVVAGSTEQARAALAEFAGGGNPAGVIVGKAARAGRPKVAFLFSGQGAQYPGMGRELYAAEPVFARALEGCAEVLDGLLDRPLLELLFAAEPGGLLDQTCYTQPALVALEIALAELWKSWGVAPDAVLGHSVGEFAAAQVAGVLSVEDALALVAARGRLMGSLQAGGAMAAVFADAPTVAGVVARCGGVVGIAALNGPAETVVSGEQAAVEAVLAELAERGVRGQRLVVSAAFHSPLVEPILGPLKQAFAGVGFGSPRIPVIANRTGQVAAAAELADPEAWCEQARGAVRFAEGMETLRELGCSVFVELGPGAALSGLGRRCVAEAPDLGWLPSLRRGRDDTAQMLESMGALWCRGVPVAWDHLAGHSRKIALPTSPFERERFWIEYVPGRSLANPVAATAEPRDSKLGELLYEPVWQSKPRVEAADLRADFLEAPATLVEYLRPRLSTLQDEHGLDAYRELLPELEVLAGAYALAGLSRLGWQPRLGERLVPGALADQLAVLPRHRRLFGRLLEMIAEDGLLQPLDGGYEVLDVPVPSDPEARRAELLVRFPAGRVELELAGRCGRALADVLRGECDPLGLLFPGDGLLGAEQLYSDAPVAQVVNSLVAETCAAVVAELPGRPGAAGTGDRRRDGRDYRRRVASSSGRPEHVYVLGCQPAIPGSRG